MNVRSGATRALYAPIDFSPGNGKQVNNIERMFSAGLYNNTGADVYLLAWDQVASPVAGQTPHFPPVRIPTGGTGFLDFPAGAPIMTGSFWMFMSSTDQTLTAINTPHNPYITYA